MGGYNSFQLAEELSKAGSDELPSVVLNDGSVSRIGSEAVAWAAGTIVQAVPNLHNASQRVLVLLGSNDSIASLSSRQERQQLLSKLPTRSRLETIKGANHSGFSSYDEASKKSSTYAMNGQRDISLKAQQEETTRLTSNFLLNK